jgi:mono/diheme cytochrome c family protein
MPALRTSAVKSEFMRYPPRMNAIRTAVLLVGAVAGRSDAAERAPTFNRDIRPILSQHCFACHGPDVAARKANLRLDRAEDASAPRDGSPAIVKGDSAASELIRRVRAHDGDETMPPPEFKKPLSAEQIATLERWIRDGAEYESHWAFEPLPRVVAVPPVRDSAWPRNDFDRFVLARLEQESLSPSQPADATTLLRRVSLDLTGIPPTPEEMAAFVADPSDAAYRAAVDRLLASPRYGERFAQMWLDLARYADSYGYQSDQLSTLWPWRDFVVEALNENLPYDQFIAWQLAGDLLPDATPRQRLATAFNRLHRLTNEGGTIHEEFRIEGVADRVNTFGAAMLGLTTECARCHDHKYDPFSTREYYSLFSLFQNIEEEGTYLSTHLTPTPSLLLPTSAQEGLLEKAEANVATAREDLARAWREEEESFERWLDLPARELLMPERVLAVDFEKVENGVAHGAQWRIQLHGSAIVPSASGSAVKLDGETAPNFEGEILGQEMGEAHAPFSIAFVLELPASYGDESRVIVQRSGGTDVGYHGFDVMLDGGKPLARMFRQWPGNALAIRGRERLPLGQPFHFACTYDGSGTAAGFALYIDGKRIAADIVHDRLWKATEAGGGFSNGFAFGARFRDRGLDGALLDDVVGYRRALSGVEVAQLVDGATLRAALAGPRVHAAELREYFGAVVSEKIRAAAAALGLRLAERTAIENGVFELPVMEEAAARPAFVLARGAYDAPDPARPVTPAIPAALGFATAFDRPDRLGLARWLTHPEHPLTARVMVNRLVALCFGRGLSATLENFGLQGEMPSHPELLDWLARDFVAHGFDMKHVLRTIVTSATYRQASARPANDSDPENVRLARGPSKRLSAEMLRDSALFAAGLLVETRGGPPVAPYQPANYWTESNSMSPGYQQSVAPDLWRRSLYTVWKRTAPMPNLTLFDAPSREACTPRRLPTNTPLQALVLLNDVQFVEAARVLAAQAIAEAEGDTNRIAAMFRRLACRDAAPDELEVLVALARSERERFAKTPDDAAKLIATGEAAAAGLDPVEHATMTAVAQTILNLDSFITAR